MECLPIDNFSLFPLLIYRLGDFSVGREGALLLLCLSAFFFENLKERSGKYEGALWCGALSGVGGVVYVCICIFILGGVRGDANTIK